MGEVVAGTLTCAIFLAGAASASVSADEEHHFLTTYHDQVIGFRTVEVSTVHREGQELTLTKVRDETRLSARGVTTRTIIRREEYTDAEGYAVFLVERRKESGQTVETQVEVTDDAVKFQTKVAGRAQAFRAKRSGNVVFDLDGEALARRGLLRVGESMRQLVVARVELGIAELEATVLEEIRSESGEREYRLRISNVNNVGEPWEIRCDEAGRTIELKIGPMQMRRVSRQEAKLPRSVAVLDNRIATERVSHLEDIRTMRVFATIPDDVRSDVFVKSIYCRPWRELDGRFRLTLTEARPDGRLPRTELPGEDRRRFLAPSPLVECDAPDIKAWAERIVEDEEEPLVKMLLLARWVYRNLTKRSTGPATASAVEALRARAGDCTEHAALFTAFARATGLPARQALGLVHDGDGFQFHAWAEAYVEDSWVPVDPTLGRLGVPGIYILLGREGDMVEYHSRANAIQGRTSMMLIDTD
jgi:transglutaminase-like putative cysteine protease